MNQRLLQRLQRHGEFPQARPDVKVARQSDAMRPFTPAQPRLALPQQPLELRSVPVMPTQSASLMSDAALAESQNAAIQNVTIRDAILGDVQAEVATLEESVAAVDRFDSPAIAFSPNDFSLNAQTADSTTEEPTIRNSVNTEATMNTARAIAVPETNDDRRASQSAAPRANPALESPSKTAQVAAQSAVLRSPPPTGSDVSESVEPRDATLEPSQTVISQETVGFADGETELPSAASSAEAPRQTDSVTEPRSLESQSSERQSPDAPSAQPEQSFDRKAAMLELSSLGVKVRVTLSNAAMKTQLEAARAEQAVSRADDPAATSREDAQTSSPETSDEQLEPPSAAATPIERDSSVVESPRTASVSPVGSLEGRPASEVIAGTEVPASDTIAGAAVVGVEVYNPPNRRAAIARPKTIQPTTNEAETMFSTLPDSKPLDWLSRLGSIGAVDVQTPNPTVSPNPAGLLIAPQPGTALTDAARIDPAALSNLATLTNPALADSALTTPARTGSAQVSTPLPTPDPARTPLAAPLGVVLNPTDPRVEPEPRSSSSSGAASLSSDAQSVAPKAVAGPASSAAPNAISSTAASPNAPVSSAVQQQAEIASATSAAGVAAQDGREATAASNAERVTRPGAEIFERDTSQRNSEQRSASQLGDNQGNPQQGSSNQRNLEQTKALEITAAEPTTDSVSEQRPTLQGEPSQRRFATGAGSIERREAEESRQISGANEPAPSSTSISSTDVSSAVTSSTNISSTDSSRTVTSSAVRLDAPTSGDAGASDTGSDDAGSNDTDSSNAGSSDSISTSREPNLASFEVGATDSNAVQSRLEATRDTGSVAGQPRENAPSSADFGSQGTVAAVEIYNPPNRRAAIARPKTIQPTTNEAETMFSTLPDSKPLDWLSRLGSIGAVDVQTPNPDESQSPSAPLIAPQREMGQSVDSLMATPMPQGEPNRSATSNPDPIGGAANSLPLAASPINPGQVLEGQALETRTSESRSQNANVDSAQVGSIQRTGRLVQNNQTGVQGDRISDPSRLAPAIPAAAVPAPIGGAPSAPRLIATPTQPAVPRAAAGPVRLSSGAQRLIAPITGIDPNTVEIRRDAESDALTRSYRADALTIDGTVLLSARLASETPETLGVIAHELTHVARGRQPRFVPPVLRQAQSLAPNSLVTPSLEGLGEEGIALQVEGITRALAQQSTVQPSAAQQNAVRGNDQLSGGSSGGTRAGSRSLESTPWSNGVLPAPWELMDRLEALTNPGLNAQNSQRGAQSTASQTAAFQSSASRPARFASPLPVSSEAVAFAGGAANRGVSSASSSGAGGNFVGGIGGTATSSSVQAAVENRVVPTTSPPVSTPSPAGPLAKNPDETKKPANSAPPAPDLDDLARQVYAVLKRRLITERRRSS